MAPVVFMGGEHHLEFTLRAELLYVGNVFVKTEISIANVRNILISRQ
jgi:hypothetical protein